MGAPISTLNYMKIRLRKKDWLLFFFPPCYLQGLMRLWGTLKTKYRKSVLLEVRFIAVGTGVQVLTSHHAPISHH